MSRVLEVDEEVDHINNTPFPFQMMLSPLSQVPKYVVSHSNYIVVDCTRGGCYSMLLLLKIL